MSINSSNEQRRQILLDAKNIAVVGCSDNPERTSYMIAEALQQAGYRVFPVNPKLTSPVLGEQPYASVADIPEQVDIVDVFRRSEYVLPVAEDAIKANAKVLWLQQGIVHEEAAQLAVENGLQVVQDHCIKVDHAVLVGKK
ncbi:CoA-binding protein [Mechercharimyces sp. CAU 1602]|uniref:CoA-binding protein n=1 Tax=Mechercharimyces sp. CAU 1602 TaxID=2973933 RepID=UPI00216137ED|nr:CoA-binding protein [Mechercharimyces sp. CAU 1602]MCS1350079.1 CoA-binding protein [Mechercharimyces sp. CAU 1602]